MAPRRCITIHCLLCALLLFVLSAAKQSATLSPTNETSKRIDFFRPFFECAYVRSFRPQSIRILYDVNPSEGFNLRRDVFLRMVVFVQMVRSQPGWSNVKLVLPPFRNLYHWHSMNNRDETRFWNHFFDLPSLAAYTDALDIWQYFDEQKMQRNQADGNVQMVYLRNFDDMFENGQFVEKFQLDPAWKGARRTSAMGYRNLSIAQQQWKCRFQGSAMLLQPMLEQVWSLSATRARDEHGHFTVFLCNAEVVLHEGFGDSEFWRARRSMRFAQPLVEVAQRFRTEMLGVRLEDDRLQRPDRWQDEKAYRGARGGKYLCAHLRRGDFLLGRPKTTPTIRSAARQIKHELLAHDLQTVFLSSDCKGSEFTDLTRLLRHPFRVVRFQPQDDAQRARLGDGGIAIVDQIVCSQAQYFIGTFDSTFTYRIYEEREIMGFPVDSTFNSLCGQFGSDADEECERNSVWPIVYG